MRSYAKLRPMNERPDPSPEGRLITETLRHLRPKMSQREAARVAGMSDARWRQIVSGYQMVSGQPVAVTAPAETIARMAQVVGATPEQLEQANRKDAAEELRKLPDLDPQARQEPTVAEVLDRVNELARIVRDRMTPEERQRFGVDDEHGIRFRKNG